MRCLLLLALVPFIAANQKCQPDPSRGGIRTYNGRPCASTTRYDDGHRGSCGCGPPNSDHPFDWNMRGFMTAPSQKFFDNGGDKAWCGANCGKCVKLTPTGGWIDGEGGYTSSHSPIIFMVTNDCPYAGNEKWCEIHGVPGTGNKNSFGYEVHFDLQNHFGQISGRGWNNPEVTWEQVGCPGDLAGHWGSCECNHNHGK